MSYGPQLPAHLQKSQEHSIRDEASSDDENDDNAYGPALPPSLKGKTSNDSKTKIDAYGPQLPKLSHSNECLPTTVQNSSSEDEDLVGPLPPQHHEMTLKQQQIDLELEKRAYSIKERLTQQNEVIEAPKRDSWMTELPQEKAKSFGLGPRQFNRSSGPKPKQDRSWTETPEMKAKRAALAASGIVVPGMLFYEKVVALANKMYGQLAIDILSLFLFIADEEKVKEPKEDKDVLEYMASLKRDHDMESVANEMKKKRGTDSLVDLHEKERCKKQKKDKQAAGILESKSERRPFDRDIDLQANRFDEAAKKAMLKKARKLNDNFSSGQQKYL